MSDIINQNTEPLFIFDMPDDETLSETISVKGEKGEKGDPTKLSDLENDEGFITANTDALVNYYKKSETDAAIDENIAGLGVPDGFFTDASEVVSGEGSSFTLNDTVEATFKDVKIYGNTQQDGTPTPETPVSIKVATGRQTVQVNTATYEINLGKNLLDATQISAAASDAGIQVTADGLVNDITPTSDSRSWGYATCNWFLTLPAGTYTLSETFTARCTNSAGSVRIYSSTGSSIVNVGNNLANKDSNSNTFTLAQKTDIGIGLKIFDGTCYIQLEKGASATSFAKYVEPMELCKLGTYQDYIYKSGDDWYIHREVDHATISSLSDGSDYAINTGSENTTRVLINQCLNGQAIYTPSEARAASKCNYFAYQSNWGTDVVGFMTDTDSGLTKNGLVIRGNKATIGTDATEVEAWLNANPLDIYYVLAEFIDEKIDDASMTALLDTLANASSSKVNTNIAVSGDLPVLLHIEAFKNNLAGTVAGTNAEISNKADTTDLKQRPYYFDSVAELRAFNLSNGDMAITTGFYSYNDGGGAKYKILNSDFSADGCSVIGLANGLQAILIVENDAVSIKQFGAKGDGLSDDTAAINKALAFRGNDFVKINFVDNATYIVNGTILAYSNTTLALNGCTLKTGNAFTIVQNNKPSTATAGYGAIKQFNVSGGTIEGAAGQGFEFGFLHAQDCIFEDIQFKNCASGHVFDLAGCNNITIRRCDFIGNLITDSSTAFREVIQPDFATHGAFPAWDDDGTVAYDGIPTDTLIVDSCTFRKNDDDLYYPNAIGGHSIFATPLNNIQIKNCTFYGCEVSNIRLLRATNVLIDNNVFYGVRSDRSGAHFAINCTPQDANIVDNVNVPSENITISNNKYYSTLTQDDQAFIGVKGYNANAPTTNVIIKNNEYNGVAVSEGGYTGLDFAQIADVDGIVFAANKVCKAKHMIWKDQAKLVKKVKLIDNICDGTLRLIRSTGSDSTISNVDGFVTCDNIWTNSLGTLNTGSFVATATLSADATISGSNVVVPIDTIDNDMIYVHTDHLIRIPSYVKRFKVRGILSLKTASGAMVNDTKLEVWDRQNQTTIQSTVINHYLSSSDYARGVTVGDVSHEDNDLIAFFSLPEVDGRFGIIVRLNTTGDVTVDASKTKIIVEGY